MAKREKISEERKKLIQEFIKSNDLKTAGDIQEAIKDLFKDTIQEMLNAELTEHLGYEKNEYTDDNENYRNGYSQKTVHSTEGDITLNVPRDRQGTFDPVIVEKGQKDISSIEEKIIKMYARGMSNQNIYEEMQELYGVKVSPDMVTAITDKIIPEIREWQKRQLEEQYAIVFVDATYFIFQCQTRWNSSKKGSIYSTRSNNDRRKRNIRILHRRFRKCKILDEYIKRTKKSRNKRYIDTMCRRFKRIKRSNRHSISNDRISTLYSSYDKKYIAICIIQRQKRIGPRFKANISSTNRRSGI